MVVAGFFMLLLHHLTKRKYYEKADNGINIWPLWVYDVYRGVFNRSTGPDCCEKRKNGVSERRMQ